MGVPGVDFSACEAGVGQAGVEGLVEIGHLGVGDFAMILHEALEVGEVCHSLATALLAAVQLRLVAVCVLPAAELDEAPLQQLHAVD